MIRDGVGRRIAGREVVRNDILVISEGDCIPADAVLLSSDNLQVDESILTGEALHVRKLASPNISGAICGPGGDDLPFVYSGTYVVQGKGVARVLAAGVNTEIGKIGKKIINRQT